jgi:hypothetical protein
MASILHRTDLIVTLTSQEVVFETGRARHLGDPGEASLRPFSNVRGVIETISLLVDWFC